MAPPQAHRPPSPSDKRPPPVNSTGWHEPKPSASPRCHTSTSPAAQHDRQLTHPGLGRDSPPYHTRTHCGRASGAALSPYDRPASATDHGALPGQRHCPRAHTAHPTAAIAKQGQAGTTDASITSTIAVIATAGTFRIQANAYYRTHAAHSPAIDICASGRSAREPLWNPDHLTLQAGPRASAYQSLPATLRPINTRHKAAVLLAQWTILISLLYSPVRDNLVIIENYYHQSSGRMRGIMTWLLTSILLALMRKSNKYRVIVMSNAEPTL